MTPGEAEAWKNSAKAAVTEWQVTGRFRLDTKGMEHDALHFMLLESICILADIPVQRGTSGPTPPRLRLPRNVRIVP